MKTYTAKELAEILAKHKAWRENEANGTRADLSGANLRGAYLREANLREANLREADLSGANLSGANLSGANLSGANLCEADLSEADLSRADLSEANMDFSQWPLWCGSFDATVSPDLIYQLCYHICRVKSTVKVPKAIRDLANKWAGIERHELSKIKARG